MKLIALILGINFSIYAQDTLIYLSNNNCTQDAYIESRLNEDNFGNHIDFAAISWTNGGTPTDTRGIIQFDLLIIPSGSIILEASLSLYSYDSPANGSHSTLSGSNESILQRITSPWDDATVTWNTQPTTTSINSVILPTSTSSIQHYPNIDVTNMVQDMIDNPNGSFGFQLSLIAESQYYRRLIFASSDNLNTSLHPQLELLFVPPEEWENNLADSCGTFSLVDNEILLELPNVITPNNDMVNDLFSPIQIKGVTSISSIILNRWGEKIYHSDSITIDWNGKTENEKEVTEGVYFWIIEYTDLNGNQLKKNGIVTVIR